MNHLTTSQILQSVDGTADYATQAVVSNHLAVCSDCRRELEFQRALIRQARRSPIPALSDRFTRNVLARIVPRQQGPVTVWLLNNMGSIFALMAVLGVFWLVLSQPISLGTLQQDSQGDKIVQQWQQSLSEGYGRINELLKAAAPKPKAERSTSPNGWGSEKLGLILISLVALIALDRLWTSRQRLRPKN